MKPSFSLCVYCGSRPGKDPRFTQTASQVGRWIGQQGGQLVYGGGNNGLMGVVADAALAAGARVVGIIPHSMVEREWAKRDCTELHVVDNMHQRKSMMAELSDAFVAMPGGLGTLVEFFEPWTWAQLGVHRKPVGLLDVAGYWHSLVKMLEHAEAEGFLRGTPREWLVMESDATVLLDRMSTFEPPPARRWLRLGDT